MHSFLIAFPSTLKVNPVVDWGYLLHNGAHLPGWFQGLFDSFYETQLIVSMCTCV